MWLKIVAVHDAKAEAWLTPQYFQAAGAAVRSFQDAANDKSTGVGAHPEDYTLFELGTFDAGTGNIEVLPSPIPLASAINLVSGSVDQVSLDQLSLLDKEA